MYVSACVCVCVCMRVSILTLDVDLLHLVDLGDGLSQLLGKPAQLLSAGGAETDQLFLLGGEGAQHGDAVSVAWRRDTRHPHTHTHC